jgi:hypothetical protein
MGVFLPSNSKCYAAVLSGRAGPPDAPRTRHESDPPGAWRPLECGRAGAGTPLWIEGSAGFGGKRKSAVKPAHSKIFGRGARALGLLPPTLGRPGYSRHTPAHARVQGLGAIFTAFRLDRPCRIPKKVRGRPGGPTLPRGRRTKSKCDGSLVSDILAMFLKQSSHPGIWVNTKSSPAETRGMAQTGDCPASRREVLSTPWRVGCHFRPRDLPFATGPGFRRGKLAPSTHRPLTSSSWGIGGNPRALS